MKEAKGILIERCRALNLGKPEFDTSSTGPAHERIFSSAVTIDGQVWGRAQAKNKREAERQASMAALQALENSQAEPAQAADTNFEGPWPIFPEVLAASLQLANARIDGKLQGQEALDKVQELALNLYKGCLENLGEVVEES